MRRSKRPHRRTSSATGCMMHQALKLAREASGLSVAQLQAQLPGDVAETYNLFKPDHRPFLI